MSARSTLRLALRAETPAISIGVHDPLSARLAVLHGFDCLHIGSFGLASRLVLPDVGLLDLTEIACYVEEIAACTDVPLIVDAEDGFYEPAGIARAVSRLERAGAAAIHIEDHISGKHTSGPRRVAPLPDMLARLHAALDARRDAELVVIGRTDIAWATENPELALERMLAFAEAGADAVMPTGLSRDMLRQFRARIPVPVIAIADVSESANAGADDGVDLWIHHDICVRAAANGVDMALGSLARRLRPDADVTRGERKGNRASPDATLEALVPYGAFEARRNRYEGAR